MIKKRLEKALGKKAHKIHLPIKTGDAPDSYAEVSDLVEHLFYKSSNTKEGGNTKFNRFLHRIY